MELENPTDIPSVEKRGKDLWFCSMCTVKFDREAFEIEEGCPGCEDMRRAQQGTRGAL